MKPSVLQQLLNQKRQCGSKILPIVFCSFCSHIVLCAWLFFAGKSAAILKNCTWVILLASGVTWIGTDWQEVESPHAVCLSAWSCLLRKAWCACEQTEVYQLCSFLSRLLFQWANLSNHQSQHTNTGPWDSPSLDERAKNSTSSCWQSH